MKILHISDPHFSVNPYQVEPHKILDGLKELIVEKKVDGEDFFIVVTGDITFQGKKEGFEEADKFFSDLLTNTSIKPENFIVCPGNHDISSNKDFDGFNTFVYKIRQDNEFKFDTSNSNRIYIKDKFCFLSINTVYHLEHTHGKVDIHGLATLLLKEKENIENSQLKIVIFHHNILNLLESDNSAIKNSYQLFELLKIYNFHFLFHGHQHAKQLFNINEIHVNSISSLLETRTVSNLVAYYEIKDKQDFLKEEYTFLKDETNSQGKQGRYRKLC